MIRIGFLGPKGTFSQEALEIYTHCSPEYQEIEYNSISELILGVEKGDIDEAIAPMENSIEGGVTASLDTLAFDANLVIKGEIALPIRQNLIVLGGTKREDIECIISHPQATGQCRKYIDTYFPGVEVRPIYSTAGGAIEVLKGEGRTASIGSIKAAEEYKLDIIAESIQDGDANITRFVVLSTVDSPPTGDDKTSIVFSTENQPGSLYRILDILSLWDINMARIESRPAKLKLGTYIFFVDIIGHREEEDVKAALTMIQRKTSFYKFLGSYPAYR